MSNAARKARKAAGQKLERVQKTPTTRHLTAKEKQVLRRESKRLDAAASTLIERLASQVRARQIEEDGR